MSKTLAVSTYSGGSSSSVWIDSRPDFRSRLSWARWVRIRLARASASIRWLRERSGAAACVGEDVPVAIAMGGESTHPRARARAECPNSPRPLLEVEQCRGSWTVETVFAGVFARGCRLHGESPDSSASPRCAPRARGDRESSRCRPRPMWRPRRADRGRGARSARRPCRPPESTRAGRRRRPGPGRRGGSPGREAAGGRRPATACGAPLGALPCRTPGSCTAASAIARSVLISDTASAPPASAAAAQAATSAVLGVSLTISGFDRQGRTARTHASQLRGVRADVEARLDVGAGDVELDRGDLLALLAGARPARDLGGGRAHDVGDQRHGCRGRRPAPACSSAQLGRSWSR